MPLNLENRRKSTVPLAIPVDDEVLNVRYRVTHMTPANLAELNRAREAALDAIHATEKADSADAGPKVETSTIIPVSALLLDAQGNPITPEKPAQAVTETLQGMFDKVEELHGILIDNLLEVVSEWDLLDGEETVPLTREGLLKHDVDFDLISYILGKIKEAKTPGPK